MAKESGSGPYKASLITPVADPNTDRNYSNAAGIQRTGGTANSNAGNVTAMGGAKPYSPSAYLTNGSVTGAAANSSMAVENIIKEIEAKGDQSNLAILDSFPNLSLADQRRVWDALHRHAPKLAQQMQKPEQSDDDDLLALLGEGAAVGAGAAGAKKTWNLLFRHRFHMLRRLWHHFRITARKIRARIGETFKNVGRALRGETSAVGREAAELAGKDAAKVAARDIARPALERGATVLAERAGARIGGRLLSAAGATAVGTLGIGAAAAGGVAGFAVGSALFFGVGFAIETRINYFSGGKNMSIAQAASKTANDWRAGVTEGFSLLKQGKIGQVARNTLNWLTGIPDAISYLRAGKTHEAFAAVAPISTTGVDVAEWARENPQKARQLANAASDGKLDRWLLGDALTVTSGMASTIASGADGQAALNMVMSDSGIMQDIGAVMDKAQPVKNTTPVAGRGTLKIFGNPVTDGAEPVKRKSGRNDENLRNEAPVETLTT